MALEQVKFLQGLYSGITTAANDKNAVLVSTDEAVAALGGKLYYGQPTLEYKNDKIILWGIKGEKETENRVELGSVDLTLDSFLEKAKYFPKNTEFSAITEWISVESLGDDDVKTAYKEAFDVAEGSELPEERSAIVMVMHGEHAGNDTHSLVVIPVGNLMGDVQTEVDDIETAVGLESDGTFVNAAEGVSKDAATIKDAIKAIDDNLGVKAEGSTLDAETVWAAIEEVAAEKTVVVKGENNLNINVTSGDTDGKVTYTVVESGLTPAENGVVISSDNTVAANLGALDTKIGAFSASPEYASAFTVAADNVIATDDTVAASLSKLDNKIKALVDEVLDNEEVASNAINALAEAAGVKDDNGEIAYQIHGTDTILSGVTTLDSADVALADAIRALQATAGALEGENAIVVNKADGQATKVSLKLDSETSATTSCAKIDLAQTDKGLFAEVKLDNTASESGAGIGLVQDTNGIKATLYWGSF